MKVIKLVALSAVACLLAACGTFPLASSITRPGVSSEQLQLDALSCKDQANLAQNSAGNQAGDFLLGMTIIGAPLAYAKDRSIARNTFANCMTARGYQVVLPDGSVRGPVIGQSPAAAQSTAMLQSVAFQTTDAAAENLQEGNAYLAKNKLKLGVNVTEDGLQYEIIAQGTGPKPTATDTVQVNYTFSFVNGQEFDSSARHGSGPAKLSIAGVLPGFKEALMLMPVGSHYQFAIPPGLAFGSKPKNGFPPNATVIFDVTLVKIGN